VSFIQSRVDLKPGCTSETAIGALTLPVLLNLVGYVTVYAFSAGFTSTLTSLGHKPPGAA
jgi:hypothetical protein